MDFTETGEKIGATVMISLMLGLGITYACTAANVATKNQSNPQTELVAIVEEEVPEVVTYEPYEHVFYRRYNNLTKDSYATEVFSGQIEIPEGYEILEINNYDEKLGNGSQTGGFDVWFINNQPVEVTPVYNPSVGGYDYSQPGQVIVITSAEEAPTKSLQSNSKELLFLYNKGS